MNSSENESEDDDFDPYVDWQPDEYVESEIKKTEEDRREDFHHVQMNVEETKVFLNQSIEQICRLVDVPRAVARRLLIKHSWDVDKVKCQFSSDALGLMIREHLLPAKTTGASISDSPDIMATLSTMQRLGFAVRPYFTALSLPTDSLCQICYGQPSLPDGLIDHHHLGATDPKENLGTTEDRPFFEVKRRMYGLSCGHCCCLDCWSSYLGIQIMDRINCFDIQCISDNCDLIIPEDFILTLVYDPKVRKKYQKCLFTEMVTTHPSLRFCSGRDCNLITRALEPVKARRIRCSSCQHEFCFVCGNVYHAPTSCSQIMDWLSKCVTNLSTAKYLNACTKLCPVCKVCIDKDGGCNHMVCPKCKYSFCWICRTAWLGSNHSCSEYKGGEEWLDSVTRYLFYYNRWLAQTESLQLEEKHRLRVIKRIDEKVSKREGTWIDWQHLVTGMDALHKCRYTLKFTYPLAYFLKVTDRKPLFEYLQAQLESQVEDLAWKVEHSDLHDRAALENSMAACEKYRMTLLREFLD